MSVRGGTAKRVDIFNGILPKGVYPVRRLEYNGRIVIYEMLSADCRART